MKFTVVVFKIENVFLQSLNDTQCSLVEFTSRLIFSKNYYLAPQSTHAVFVTIIYNWWHLQYIIKFPTTVYEIFMEIIF